MARRVVVEVKAKLIIKVADGVDVNDVINELDYGFVPTDDSGSILISEEIVEHEVVSNTKIIE